MRTANDNVSLNAMRLVGAYTAIERLFLTITTMRALSGLDDLQLKDIGLERKDIPVAANDAALAARRKG